MPYMLTSFAARLRSRCVPRLQHGTPPAPRRRRSRSAARCSPLRCRLAPPSAGGTRSASGSAPSPVPGTAAGRNPAASAPSSCGTTTRRPPYSQRAPDLPHREVEGIGVEQRPHIFGVRSRTSAAWPQKQPGDVAVLDHHTFGRAGGAGGVDDVGQVARVEPGGLAGRIGVRLAAQAWESAWRSSTGTAPGSSTARLSEEQQHGRSAVIQHVGQALGRISGVERHVSAAGLEDGEQCRSSSRDCAHTDRHMGHRASRLARSDGGPDGWPGGSIPHR